MIIAIDGPAGTGKSAVCKNLLNKFDNSIHVNTGLFYRLITYLTMKTGINIKKEEEIFDLLKSVKFNVDNLGFIYFNNCNINEIDLNKDDIAMLTSKYISNYIKVRSYVTQLVRNLFSGSYAKERVIIVDGRDSTTVIFPDTKYKFFLTAEVRVRANRRYLQCLKQKNICNYTEILKNLLARDYNDITRNLSPLRYSTQTTLINNTNMDIITTTNKILESLI